MAISEFTKPFKIQAQIKRMRKAFTNSKWRFARHSISKDTALDHLKKCQILPKYNCGVPSTPKY